MTRGRFRGPPSEQIVQVLGVHPRTMPFCDICNFPVTNLEYHWEDHHSPEALERLAAGHPQALILKADRERRTAEYRRRLEARREAREAKKEAERYNEIVASMNPVERILHEKISKMDSEIKQLKYNQCSEIFEGLGSFS